MIAATLARQRPLDAKLLVLDAAGRITQAPRSEFASFMYKGDLMIANDAATMPASLHGTHAATGAAIEVRLAGRDSLAVDAVRSFSAVVFGAGDYRTRTEDRPPPPPLAVGDELILGPLRAQVQALLGHPRLIRLDFTGTLDQIWQGLVRHGRPIQYAHLQTPLQLWDVWSRIAAPPVAFEPPSAGYLLDWKLLAQIRAAGARFATLTHAAGISSTGDVRLDARLPLDEPYNIPAATLRAIAHTRAIGGRVIAIGTTVVRALEHAADFLDSASDAINGVATQRIGPATTLRVVNAILSGTHEPDTSHFELLQAFAGEAQLLRVSRLQDAGGYRTHEFGDSVLIEAVADQPGAMRYAESPLPFKGKFAGFREA